MSTSFRVMSVVGVVLLAGGVVAWAADPPATQVAPTFEPCSTCHDSLSAEFAGNPHGLNVARGGALKCESCHGDGTKHIDAGGDTSLIKIPSGDEGARVCLTCHQGKIDTSVSGHGAHATAGVYCTDCHSIHGAKLAQRALLKAPSVELCVSCHSDQLVDFRKPFAHKLEHGGMNKGGMECTSCHNPHAGKGLKSLKRTTGGELACVSCHTDVRGPFVFEHVADINGNCMTCHEPHGSVNEKRLIRSSVQQLCLECHTGTPGNLGSQPPSLHDLRSPRYQNCTSCHVAIHGSNSSPLLLK
ncbi:MAG: DmsE family decaheme c-type cytochrome [Acidobacteriota bacterium]